jgi:hypothetical protein
MMAMFAIGEESGFRNGEVCNIRLQDVCRNVIVRSPHDREVFSHRI